MTLKERFEEIGVPAVSELPDDMAELVMRCLDEGRILMITKVEDPDGVHRAEWSFLRPAHKEKRTQIIPDPDLPPPYDPNDLQ